MKQDWEKDQWNDEVITLCHVILSTLDDQQENNSVETLKCNHVNKFLSLLPSTSWFRFPHTLLKRGIAARRLTSFFCRIRGRIWGKVSKTSSPLFQELGHYVRRGFSKSLRCPARFSSSISSGSRICKSIASTLFSSSSSILFARRCCDRFLLRRGFSCNFCAIG